MKKNILAAFFAVLLIASFSFAVDGEIVRNSGFETWTSSTQPKYWTRDVIATSSIDQEAGDVHGGLYSAKFTIDASNHSAQLYTKIRLVASQAYTVSIWYKTAASKTLYIKLRDIGNHVWLKSDGTWAASETTITCAASTVWAQKTVNFTSDATYTVYYLFVARLSDAGTSFFIDDFSIQGPLPPADDYYIDTTGGIDSNDGLSPATAWKTVTPVNNFLSVPGDNYLFKCGEEFPGQLLPSASGTAESPITYGSYASGAKPVMDGTGHNYAIGCTYDYVHFVGLDLQNGTVCGLYLSSNNHIEIDECDLSGSADGIYAAIVDELLINDTNADGNTGNGIRLLGVTNADIFDSTASSNGVDGLVVGTSGTTAAGNVTATDCTFSSNGTNGISLTSSVASSGFTATRVTTNLNLNDGFNVHNDWSSVVADHCTSNENGDDGIGADGDGFTFHETSSGTIKYSTASNNKKSAVAHINSSSVLMYMNKFTHTTNGTIALVTLADTGTHWLYNNIISSQSQTGYGVHISCAVTVQNNIIVGFDNGFWNDSGTITEDHNDVYGAGTANFVTHSPGTGTKQVDPVFYSSTDFRLRSYSPVLRAGVSVGLTTDYAGLSIPAWTGKAPDMGAYEMRSMFGMVR